MLRTLSPRQHSLAVFAIRIITATLSALPTVTHAHNKTLQVCLQFFYPTVGKHLQWLVQESP